MALAHSANSVEQHPNRQPRNPNSNWCKLQMNGYSIQLELSGPIAQWSRPDTMPNPVSYVAPTLSAVNGIFEAVVAETMKKSGVVTPQLMAESSRATCGRLVEAYR